MTFKFNTNIPEKLKPYYDKELEQYIQEYVSGNLSKAWNHLERAHVIGQRYPYAHTYIHWKMLQFGFKIKSTKEIIGQIPRLLVGGIKSFVGFVPKGNTGGSNISALKSLPIDKELQSIFINAEVEL